MLIKICGLKDTNTILCCENNGADYFGLIFYNKSSRYIDLSQAFKLIEFSKNKKIKPVGVFVNEKIDKVKSFINKLELKYIQLHGSENNDYINEIKKTTKVNIIKAISIKNNQDFNILNNYKSNDLFLFDYKPEEGDLPGGNAKKFNWSLLSEKKIEKPWFLSGGINASNINKIKNFTNPDGIDLSSGVEDAPGIKNNEMINNLFKKYNAK